MANVFNLIRSIERSYGRLVEHKIIHDAELPHLYRKYLYVTFAERESAAALEQNPAATFEAIDLPYQVGGPRLSDVAPFLRRGQAGNKLPTLPKGDRLGARGVINPPNYTPRINNAERLVGKVMRAKIAANWLDFGGFARLDPIPAGTDLYGPGIDQPRKRALFRRNAEKFEVENIYELVEGQAPSPAANEPAAPAPAREFKPLTVTPKPFGNPNTTVPSPPMPDPFAAAPAESSPALPDVSPDLPSPLPSPTASLEAQAFAAKALREKRPVINAKRAGVKQLPTRDARFSQARPANRRSQANRQQSASDILSSKPIPQASQDLQEPHDDSLLAEVRETFFSKKESEGRQKAQNKPGQKPKTGGLFGGWF